MHLIYLNLQIDECRGPSSIERKLCFISNFNLILIGFTQMATFTAE